MTSFRYSSFSSYFAAYSKLIAAGFLHVNEEPYFDKEKVGKLFKTSRASELTIELIVPAAALYLM